MIGKAKVLWGHDFIVHTPLIVLFESVRTRKKEETAAAAKAEGNE
jgi:hypothetical protein